MLSLSDLPSFDTTRGKLFWTVVFGTLAVSLAASAAVDVAQRSWRKVS